MATGLRHDLRFSGYGRRRTDRRAFDLAPVGRAGASVHRDLLWHRDRLFVLAAFMGGIGWAFWPIAALATAMLARQVWRLEIHNPARCLALFRNNVPYGIVLACAFAIGRHAL